MDGQVVETEGGKIEFVGLEQWSVDELMQAVQSKCDDYYCAANLKGILGFPDAAVFTLKNPQPRKVVAVVEPQFASRVSWKEIPAAPAPFPTGWDALLPIPEADSMAFDLALRHYPILLARGEEKATEAF